MAPRNENDPPIPDSLLDEEDTGTGRGSSARGPGLVPEFVRKMAVAGLGAIFMTEEGLRSLASQLKLPKEALGFVLSQAEKTKDDISRIISEEVRRFLQSETLRDEFLKLLSGMTIEVKAQIRLMPPGEQPPESKGHGASAAAPPRIDVTELNARRGGKRTRRE
jgi:hypothetical protein